MKKQSHFNVMQISFKYEIHKYVWTQIASKAILRRLPFMRYQQTQCALRMHLVFGSDISALTWNVAHIHVCSISHGSWNAQTKVGDLKKLLFQSGVVFWFNVFWPCSVPSHGFYMKEGTLQQKGPQGQNQFWCIVSKTCSDFLEQFINNFFSFKMKSVS